MPFRSPFDVLARLVVEPWVTFPRFVLSGGFVRAWREASDLYNGLCWNLHDDGSVVIGPPDRHEGVSLRRPRRSCRMHRDEIPIASPCGVYWNGMTLADAKKRFCADCKKHVHDLSQMSRAEARTLLSSTATENLCVRYLHDERGEIWFAPEAAPLVAPGRLARVKRFALAAAAVAAPLSLTACMGAAPTPPPQPPMPAAAESATPPRPTVNVTPSASTTPPVLKAASPR